MADSDIVLQVTLLMQSSCTTSIAFLPAFLFCCYSTAAFTAKNLFKIVISLDYHILKSSKSCVYLRNKNDGSNGCNNRETFDFDNSSHKDLKLKQPLKYCGNDQAQPSFKNVYQR